MRRIKISPEAFNVLSLMVTIESKGISDEASMEKVLEYAHSLKDSDYYNFVKGVYDLLLDKLIYASGEDTGDAIIFDKLETTKKGQKFYMKYLRNGSYPEATVSNKKSLEEMSKVIVESKAFELIERGSNIVNNVISIFKK